MTDSSPSPEALKAAVNFLWPCYLDNALLHLDDTSPAMEFAARDRECQMLARAFDEFARQAVEIARLRATAGGGLVERVREIVPAGFLAQCRELLLPSLEGVTEDKLRQEITTFAAAVQREARDAARTECAEIAKAEAARICQIPDLSERGWGAVDGAEEIERRIRALADRIATEER